MLAVAVLSSCSGGSGSLTGPQAGVEIALPALADLRSDVPSRPQYGTAADPLLTEKCAFAPWPDWQRPVCDGAPPRPAWPRANFYSTGQAGAPYWTLVVNNEPAFDVSPCTSGMPGRSMLPGEGAFSVRHDARSITLKLENGTDDNCRKIPYLGINNFESGTLAGRYGDGLTIAFDATTRISATAKHLNSVNFFVRFVDASGMTKFAWIYLYSPPGTSEARFFWNWPIPGSTFAPGALIRMAPVDAFNRISDRPIAALPANGSQQYTIELDRVVRVLFPDDANPATRIQGVEFSVEHEFVWSAPPPLGTILTEVTLGNLRAWRRN